MTDESLLARAIRLEKERDEFIQENALLMEKMSKTKDLLRAALIGMEKLERYVDKHNKELKQGIGLDNLPDFDIHLTDSSGW